MSYIGRQLNLPASTVQLTAEGAITAGKPCIVEADGDVTEVSGTSASQSTGSAVVFEAATSENPSVAYDANAQKIVIVYPDGGNSSYGTAIVGTVSGSSISFGSPVVYNSANSNFSNVAYDANAQKVVVVYRDAGNSYYGTAIVGTVSGTSISFGSETVFAGNGASNYNAIAYDASAQKVVVAFQDDGNSSHGYAAVGTVSGTSISFGSATAYETATSAYQQIAYDANAEKVVIAYSDGGNSNKGTAVVGTVSGTSISFGTPVEVQGTGNGYGHSTLAYHDDAQKLVFAYQDVGNSNYGTAVVGTVSGTSISFGTEVVLESNSCDSFSAVYHTVAKEMAIAYRGTSNNAFVIVGTVSGTSISFNTAVQFESTSTEMSGAYHTSEQKIVIGYRDYGNSNYGQALVYQIAFDSTNLTSENFIGFAENDCTDNGLATIQLGGSVNDKQTSLTAGQTYFVQRDGTIGTTAASPSVTAGTAVSSTEILVKG